MLRAARCVLRRLAYKLRVGEKVILKGMEMAIRAMKDQGCGNSLPNSYA